MGAARRGRNASGVPGEAVVANPGRARAVRVESGRAVMQIEKSCGVDRSGLFPRSLQGRRYPDRDRSWTLRSRLPGAEVADRAGSSLWSSDFAQVGPAVTGPSSTSGPSRGLEVRPALSVFHQEGKCRPVAIGNAVVVRTGARWATVKILASNGLRPGGRPRSKSSKVEVAEFDRFPTFC
ncbi:MAG: hypothetical protein MZU79_01360 [Anaerotruncus sp.]|nr:hypothetical protein [Anaerotruncus sp.]